MKTKLLLTLLISLSVFLTGCGKEVKQTNDSLTVYVNWNYKKPMELATKIFQEKYPEIEVTLIDGVKLTGPEIDEESTRVATELMAGAGPDVFLLETQWDLDKMIDKGVFADLSQFYEESECFKSDNWEDKIIDGGRRGDYRFCIPVEYGIPLLVTSKTALEKSGINIENMQDFQGFMKETTAYMEHRKAGVEGPRLFRMDGTVVPRTCIMWSNLPFIDWNMQTTNLEREEVKNFFAWCALVEEQWEQDYYSDSFNDFLGAASIRDGVALFDNQRGVFSFDSAMNEARLISCFDESVIIPVQNQSGGISAFVDLGIAVRGNSANQLNAWRFIEIFMSTEVQTCASAYQGRAFKVNKEAQRHGYEMYSSHFFGQENEGFPSECPPFTEEEYAHLMGYMNEIDNVSYRSRWQKMLYELMMPYVLGESTYEETAEQAKYAMEIYLSE